MKKICFGILYCTAYLSTFAQPTVPFSSCPTAQVLIYKDGINCTATPYNFYLLDLAGTLTPFGSPTAAGEEINAISVSSTDKFLYGLQYTRTGNGNPCTFSNTRFIRMDAAGTTAELGTITPPTGGAISNAFGTISTNGKYLFLATVGANLFLGVISSVEMLPASAGAITATYIPITNNCSGKSIADWAISPVDGNLYSYATYPETIMGITYMRGVVVKIDLTTYNLDCIGAINTTEFLDPARDNFGGIMYGNDNYLYGVNINTRKFYKIDVLTGSITYVSTFAGSGNMRADLGSCVSAPVVLDVKLSDFIVTTYNCTNKLSWKIADAENVISQTILYSKDGNTFLEIGQAPKNSNDFLHIKSENIIAYYKIKIVEKSGNITFSPIVSVQNKCFSYQKLKIINNPVNDFLLAYYKFGNKEIINIEIISANGATVLKMENISTIEKIEINMNKLTSGLFIMRVTNTLGEVITEKFLKN